MWTLDSLHQFLTHFGNFVLDALSYIKSTGYNSNLSSSFCEKFSRTKSMILPKLTLVQQQRLRLLYQRHKHEITFNEN